MRTDSINAAYLDQIRRRYRPLTADEERSLHEKAKAGDHAAREVLVHSVLPLAVKMSGKYAERGIPRDDLVQLASLAALQAVDRLDPDKGRLSTMLGWQILAILGQQCMLWRGGTIIRHPKKVRDTLPIGYVEDWNALALVDWQPESEYTSTVHADAKQHYSASDGTLTVVGSYRPSRKCRPQATLVYASFASAGKHKRI